jgi:hypothetical protein
MELRNKDCFDEYLNLLRFSFELLEKDKLYWAYAEYIWDIVISYVMGLKETGDYRLVQQMETFVSSNGSKEGINWFGNKLKAVKAEYQRYIGVPKSIEECIKLYNAIKSKQYVDIATVSDLKDRVQEVLDKNLRQWIEIEGAKDLLYGKDGEPIDETRICKIVEVKLREELSRLSITVLREVPKLDDERVDFYISFGLSPSLRLVIEVKKSKHGDLGPEKNLSETESFKKLKRYIGGFDACHAVFLVFNVHCNADQWDQLMANVRMHYDKVDRVKSFGIDAFS